MVSRNVVPETITPQNQDQVIVTQLVSCDLWNHCDVRTSEVGQIRMCVKNTFVLEVVVTKCSGNLKDSFDSTVVRHRTSEYICFVWPTVFQQILLFFESGIVQIM